jgi:hypothetical protein
MLAERLEEKREENFVAELLPFFRAGRSYPWGKLPSQEKDLKPIHHPLPQCWKASMLFVMEVCFPLIRFDIISRTKPKQYQPNSFQRFFVPIDHVLERLRFSDLPSVT